MADVENAQDAQPWDDDPIEDADTVPAAAPFVAAEAPAGAEEPAKPEAPADELPPAPTSDDVGLPAEFEIQADSGCAAGEVQPAAEEAPAPAPPPPEVEPDGGFKQYLKAVHAAMAKHAAKGGMGAIAEVTKRATQAWEGFTELERAPWEAKALSAGAEAKEPLRPAGQQVLFGKPQDNEASAKKKKPEKKKDPNAPKKPVGGAYGIFSSEKRAEFQQAAKAKGEKGLAAVAKLTSEAWRALSAEDRKQYDAKFSKAMEDYKAEMAKYTENRPPEEAQATSPEQGVKRKASPTEKPKKEARKEPAPSAAAAAAAKRALFGLPAAKAAGDEPAQPVPG